MFGVFIHITSIKLHVFANPKAHTMITDQIIY